MKCMTSIKTIRTWFQFGCCIIKKYIIVSANDSEPIKEPLLEPMVVALFIDSYKSSPAFTVGKWKLQGERVGKDVCVHIIV